MSLLRLPLLLLAAAVSLPLSAQPREPFPIPFAVEHHVLDGSLGGAPVAGETVRDTYGGSFLVSERADGGRTIVDFARRELTEVRSKEGTYWSLSFGRLAELRRRLEEAEEREASPKVRAQAAEGRPAVRVEEVREDAGAASRTALSVQSPPEKRLRASVAGGPSLDVWVDATAPRLTPEGVAALADFERNVLGTSDGSVGPAELLEAIRLREGGVLAVRTRRTVGRADTASENGPFLETVVTKAEPIASLPPALVTVPEGLKRVPSPLEVVVSWTEDEAALRQRGRR